MNSKLLLRLYPRGWRQRYGDEFAALLEEEPGSFAVILDVVRGAVDAHLHPGLAGGGFLPMINAPRTKVLAVFCAYTCFVLAGATLYYIVDDSPFIPAMHRLVPLALAWDVVAAGSVLASLAVMACGVPIAAAVIKRVFRKERRDLVLVAMPFLALAVLGLYVAGIIALSLGWLALPGVAIVMGPNPAGQASPNVWVGQLALSLFALGAVASVAALCAAIVRTDGVEQTLRGPGITIVVQPYRFALHAAVVAALSMAGVLAGTVIWGILASAAEPEAFAENLGPWLGIVALMAVATAVAAVAIVRGSRPGAAARAE